MQVTHNCMWLTIIYSNDNICRKVFSFHIFACLHILYIIIGGVGILATGPLSADETRNAIRTIRSNTDKPFGIGAITYS